MMDDFTDIVEQPFPGPYWFPGVVVERKDPEGLKRVRVRIPGELEPFSDWLFPFGGYYPGKKRGGMRVPPMGAKVACCWFRGKRDGVGFYIPGMWHRGWMPSGDVVDEDGGDNAVYQDDKFRVEVDTRTTTAGLRITSLGADGDSAGTDVELELDFVTKQLKIYSLVGLAIEADGAIKIEGGVVTINGRPVSPGTKPI